MPEFKKSLEDVLSESKTFVEAALTKAVFKSKTDFDAACDWILFAAELVQQYRGARRAQMFGELSVEKK